MCGKGVWSSLSRLGLAYAGSYREDVVEIITQVLWDASTTFEVCNTGRLLVVSRRRLLRLSAAGDVSRGTILCDDLCGNLSRRYLGEYRAAHDREERQGPD